jgi:ribonuclease P protein component
VVTPAGRGLPKAARLLRPADFARVYAGRCSAAAGPLVLYAWPSAAGTASRLGLAVSRRIGNAVVRNRWKRVLREAFRAVRGGLPAGHDFVLVVRSGAAPSGAEAQRHTGEAILALAARVVGRPGYGRPRPPAADGTPPRRRR